MSNLFSNVVVFPLKEQRGNIVANGSVVVSDVVKLQFAVVLNKDEQPFVSFPSRKGKDAAQNDKWYPHTYITEKEASDELNALVVVKYNEFKNKDSSNVTSTEASATSEEYVDDLPF